MTLTTATTDVRTRRARLRRSNPTRLDLRLDTLILGLALIVCAALFPQGGLEALLGAAAGALIALRAPGRSAVSGALAGLWAGAMCAGFFHGALVALVSAF